MKAGFARRLRSPIVFAWLICLTAGAAACSEGGDVITVYSGRTANLIDPLLREFASESGIDIEVRYGQSADLALLIETEGDRSPADVFISQSPGAMGFLAEGDRLMMIDEEILGLVDPSFRNTAGRWVGMSGRVRTLVYNTDLTDPAELPSSVFDLTGERYRGRVATAPPNGSFQDFITAMRQVHGDAVTLEWLRGMAANESRTYPNNTSIVQAVGRGEIPMGLVNHYYNYRARAENPNTPSENHYMTAGDIGSLLIVTAIGIVDSSDNPGQAAELVRFMLGPVAQTFFSEQTFEYPLAAGAEPAEALPSWADINITTYDFDRLGGGLERTKELIDESGLEGS